LSDKHFDRSPKLTNALSSQTGTVTKFFGIPADDSGYSAIADALHPALIHDSFLYEHRDSYPDVTRGVLRGLEAFGKAWVGREIAVRLYLGRDFDSVGQLSALHAATTLASRGPAGGPSARHIWSLSSVLARCSTKANCSNDRSTSRPPNRVNQPKRRASTMRKSIEAFEIDYGAKYPKAVVKIFDHADVTLVRKRTVA
jgi:hypothetical protein